MQESIFLYSVERTYPVSIQKLWDAWANPEALKVWYCPTDLSVAEGSVANDPTVGGIWTVGVSVPEYGFVAYFFGEYINVIDHELLEHTMTYTQSPEEFAARVPSPVAHLVRIEFKEVAGGAWCKFSQFGELPEGQAPQAQKGMESYFDNLGLYLERSN
ncbi:MAG: SRPBCC domain-containing protein [Actinobacteria bacterium]|nr:SRPBCC domain-containing protein [Actinomycetota bacterium]